LRSAAIPTSSRADLGASLVKYPLAGRDRPSLSTATHQRFNAALEALIGQIKCDRSILAAILCGSLSYDKVWDKSDIDLVLVTIDDNRPAGEGLSVYADGINIHALTMPRAAFRKTVEGSIRNSFQHSFRAKWRLLYTHGETSPRSVSGCGRSASAISGSSS
jgi:hypothetical protein